MTAKAVEEGLKLSEAVTQAMEIWVRQRRAKPKARLLDMKPFNWGPGTERLSVRIDQILYGKSHDGNAA